MTDKKRKYKYFMTLQEPGEMIVVVFEFLLYILFSLHLNVLWLFLWLHRSASLQYSMTNLPTV